MSRHNHTGVARLHGLTCTYKNPSVLHPVLPGSKRADLTLTPGRAIARPFIWSNRGGSCVSSLCLGEIGVWAFQRCTRWITWQLDDFILGNCTLVNLAIGRWSQLPSAHSTPRFPCWRHLAILPPCSFTGPARVGRRHWCEGVGEPRGYLFISLDDDVARLAAESDPAGFVAGLPDRVILDEVQRIPSLFSSLKQKIDRHRVPGRFLQTGSSQMLLLPMLSDSLAGRLEIIHLHPLSQCEIGGGCQWRRDTGSLGRGNRVPLT